MNALTLLTNLLILLATLDATWSPVIGMEETDLSFVRVGSVDHRSARILARIPPAVELEEQPTCPANGTEQEVGQLTADKLDADAPFPAARIQYRPTKPLGAWLPGPTLSVSAATDYTGSAIIPSLWASTPYEFRLLSPSLSDNSLHPKFPSQYTFTTFPDPALSALGAGGAGTHFTFASTSCVKPGFPYRGPWSKRVVKGATWLREEAEREGIRFLLFLGDFIYADTPFYGGPFVDSYHKRYRQTMASPEMKLLLEKLPTVAIWDDHESLNDASALQSFSAYEPANTAFGTYLGAANPAPAEPGQNYFEFRHGDAAFFVWDLRTWRSANGEKDEKDGVKTMLGERQKEVFLDWVSRVNETVTWKFIVSSVPMMTLWSYGSDTWSSFMTERDEILNILGTVPNVIVLSGDRHEFAAATLLGGVTEFSTSPLNQFYVPIRTLSQNNGRGATGEEVLLKYLPIGNSKFSTFEVDTRNASRPAIRVKVVIDGKEAWTHEVLGKSLPIPIMPSALGSLGKSLLELLGFQKRSWF